jgi:ERF superfamily
MPRSSSSIASLAAALAKAQAVLVNPEKSLIGTIPADRSGGSERSFRYASLASGLDIVRKTLGEHEIATVQTTAIDQTAGVVNLTTVLAHSSGEWIASDWPVCPISETATPHRMGAALTYARRYALFTLVGIAGEDDLDAPDLASPTPSPDSKRGKPSGNGHLNGNGSHNAHSNVKTKTGPRPVLGAAASTELRDRLVAQIAEIGSSDDAALWVYVNMRAKNGLSAADARQVEEAFQGKLATVGSPMEGISFGEQDAGAAGGFAVPTAGKPDGDASIPSPAGVPALGPAEPNPAPRRRRARRTKSIGTIDKAVLPFPEPRRIRDREHVRFVAQQPCLICGRLPSDAHHLRFTQSRALGRKNSDQYTVPLCRGHHREVHRYGDEAAWWQKVALDPTLAARNLWLETHPLPANQDRSNVGVAAEETGRGNSDPLSANGPAEPCARS